MLNIFCVCLYKLLFYFCLKSIICSVILMDLYMLKETCIIWMRHTWSWYMIIIRNFLIWCTQIILRNFGSRFISKIFLWFIFVVSLSKLSIKVIKVLKGIFDVVSSLFIFWSSLKSTTVSSSTQKNLWMLRFDLLRMPHNSCVMWVMLLFLMLIDGGM